VVSGHSSAHILEGTDVVTYIDCRFVAYLNAYYAPFLKPVTFFRQIVQGQIAERQMNIEVERT
jgi:hypothetical protein